MPIARAMLLEYPKQEQAWHYDLQYMWGPDLLVAPFTSADQVQQVWLPPGKWFDYWQPQHAVQGGAVIPVKPNANQIALFVKAGAVIPRQKFALSTQFADKSVLLLDVYAGADGDARLVEDDDTTEEYQRHGKVMTTTLGYRDADRAIHIGAAQGDYTGAPSQRSYQVTLHGAPPAGCYTINGVRTTAVRAGHDGETRITVPPTSIRTGITIAACTAG
jgi:alpha-D-xyloside xylohydrolase